MRPARHGQAWTEEEDEQLLQEIRRGESASEIKDRHQRTERAIVLRAAALAGTVHTAAPDVDPFEWVRSCLLRENSLPDWSARLRRSYRGVTQPASHSSEPNGLPSSKQPEPESVTSASIQLLREQCRVQEVWAEIVGAGPILRGTAAELRVLAQFDEVTLRSAGTRLLDSCGRLTTPDWILECDWPDVERLRLSSRDLREGAEEARIASVELLSAATRVIRSDRDRDVLLRRVGLRGSSTKLADIGADYGITRERVRQLVTRAMVRLAVGRPGEVFRAWDHTRGVLRTALQTSTGALDPELVLVLVEAALPRADIMFATRLVANLSGHRHAADILCDQILRLVHEREQRQRAIRRSTSRQERRKRGFHELIDKADWPEDSSKADPARCLPVRVPREPDHRSIAGRWKSPLLGRFVGYDSQVELDFIRLLEESDLVEDYCEQPLEIEYEFDGRRRRYFPDFIVTLRDGRRFLVEIKATLGDFAMYQNMAKLEAARQYCDARGWGLLGTEGRHSLVDLRSRAVAPAVESALRDWLGSRVVGWPLCREFMREQGIPWADVASVIYRERWHWRIQPFRLSVQV
ncbi:TnsA endonuclease N-terminal domain-containing protein [Nocardia sp. NPDC050406]|uniref:TnsA endonuclease N-terminal domain-containing protein n=1 Tax=Nocardia sp. NPDC050406 TaxID=3364318 RepID=UPI0037B576B2